MTRLAVYHLAPAWENAIPESANPVYAPMTTVDLLQQYPLAGVTHPSVLAIWATPHALGAAFELLQWWGYTYETASVWHKTGRKECEIALLSWRIRRYTPRAPIPTWLTAPETPATRVPTAYYHALQRAYPNAQFIDLLAPAPPSGWASLTRVLTPTATPAQAQAQPDHSTDS